MSPKRRSPPSGVLGMAARPVPRRAGAPFDPDAAAGADSGLFGLTTSPEQAGVVVIPVPFDATTSYRPGTALGPGAVLAASRQVDLFDADFGRTYEAGISMLAVPSGILALSRRARRRAETVISAGGAAPGNRAHARAVAEVDAAGDRVHAWVRKHARRHLDEGRLVGVLGGDHSVPFGLIAEVAERHPGVGILHVDAHCDLRDAYEGFRWSHASIMHAVATRIPSVGRIVQVGLRDFGEGEVRFAAASRGRIRTLFEADVRARLMAGGTWDAACRAIVADLPAKVHVSFDIDGLSPDLCPNTGTPVPGGLSFAEAVHLLRVLSERREVVGFDLCEVAPGPGGGEWDANVGARVLYKLIGCAVASRGRRSRRPARR